MYRRPTHASTSPVRRGAAFVTDADAGGGRRRLRREPRRGDSRGLVTTVVLLSAGAVAVIAGFVILRSITDPTDEPDDAVSEVATTVASTPPSTVYVLPTTTASTTSTTAARTASPSDATVVVANASGVGGSATAMAAELTAAGYTMAPVANSPGPELQVSIIYYLQADPAALPVAQLLAAQIPTAQTQPMPDPPPLDRPLGAATVALMLGRDAAGRSLADLRTG